jgi:hypothetical protein
MIRLESSTSGEKVIMEFYHEDGANIQELCEKFGCFLLAVGYAFDPVTHEVALVEKDA